MTADCAEAPATRPGRHPAAVLAALVAFTLWLVPGVASAQIGSDRYSAIVLDARGGNVLIAANADEERYPASLTKMMTLYMLFEALRDNRVNLTSPIAMTEEAASRPPSKLGLPPGMTLTVEQAILALVTKSANDVAAAVAEHLGGSEDRFAQLMTMRARSIGMTRTTFRNASGLPDQENTTTARDMATLGLRLIRDFPNRYHYFGTTHFSWGRAVIRNHNRMVGDYEGADGIKTGYIRASGFNIVTSAQRDGVRLVGVTMGGSSWVERDRHMGALLDQGFAQLGVAPRRPSSVMAAAAAAPVVGAARAATSRGHAQPVRRAAAAPSDRTPQTRVGPGHGTTAAATARRALEPPRARSATPTAQRVSARSNRTRTASSTDSRTEQGSRASLPPPVPRGPRGSAQASR